MENRYQDRDGVFDNELQEYVTTEKVVNRLNEYYTRHHLDELEWQNYCAFKHIEPQIKGCLDREKELTEKLEESELEAARWQEHFEQAKLDYQCLKEELAASEEKCKKAYREGLLQKQFDKDVEIEQLKQQLAEKDKEIDFMKLQTNKYLEKGMVIVRQQDLENIDKKHNKCKIDFAVEKLERVKELVENRNNGTRNGNHSEQYKDGYSGCCCDIADHIDNQIKQLKDGK